MILPVSSCYHNHSFLHFRLTSNQTGGKKKPYKQKDTVSSLPEGKKTHLCLETPRDTCNIRKHGAGRTVGCWEQGTGKGGETPQQT